MGRVRSVGHLRRTEADLSPAGRKLCSRWPVALNCQAAAPPRICSLRTLNPWPCGLLHQVSDPPPPHKQGRQLPKIDLSPSACTHPLTLTRSHTRMHAQTAGSGLWRTLTATQVPSGSAFAGSLSHKEGREEHVSRGRHSSRGRRPAAAPGLTTSSLSLLPRRRLVATAERARAPPVRSRHLARAPLRAPCLSLAHLFTTPR